MKLTARLMAIATFIPAGSFIADIGTDHALLPIYLVSKGISPMVIAGDLNEGPLEAARKNIVAAGLSDKIIIKKGFGLEVVESSTQVAVIAGMGGSTISDIIEKAGPDAGRLRLVLQPMADADFLRTWLAGNGWKIEDEELVMEDGRLYEIIAAVPGIEESEDTVILKIGPRLFEKRHPLLREKLQTEINKNRGIIINLQQGISDEAKEKISILTENNRDLERIAACLSSVKQ